MSTQRMIEFTATTDEGRRRVTEAIAKIFEALKTEQPEGLRLAYWRSQDGHSFVAMIDLADEGSTPLLDIGPARELPRVIGEHAEGGHLIPKWWTCSVATDPTVLCRTSPVLEKPHDESGG